MCARSIQTCRVGIFAYTIWCSMNSMPKSAPFMAGSTRVSTVAALIVRTFIDVVFVGESFDAYRGFG